MTISRYLRYWLVLCGLLCAALLHHSAAGQGGASPTITPPGTEVVAPTPQPSGQATGESNGSGSADGGDGSSGDAIEGDNNTDKGFFDKLGEQDFGETLHTIWNATLFTAGDTDIKLNQLIIALLVALIGMFLAKRVTKFISGRLIKVSKVSETVAFTLGKIIYYIAAAVVILIAMQVAGIPTTVFTVLGGALAIGVGFGAQNLFNNLISGIIILTEQPIRRRDIVEIDGMEGMVAEIGNRRTRIRTPDGIDVLVPNSTFLETNVINWTLYDSNVRGHVAVGVAYGSPVRQVRDLLLQAAKDHKRIDQNPEPVVLFTEFGDNTLNFSLFFWTHVTRPLDRRQIESDLRFEVDDLFKEADITIAFPQRDVHLDTLKPLEVRMVEKG